MLPPPKIFAAGGLRGRGHLWYNTISLRNLRIALLAEKLQVSRNEVLCVEYVRVNLGRVLHVLFRVLQLPR